ncbi:MAG: DUF4331 family protein [Chitinophagaceae bacterium]|nr:DUF4331 family protein [Chitinophagaceae bacterium]HQZ51500.1 DUF4331 family protein [Chitinophagaceae bacterium]
MKKKLLLGSLLGVVMVGGIIFAADHIDAPAVTGAGPSSLNNDITDIYAFQSPADNSKMVFVMNTQGLLSPAASATATFPSNVMFEFNIDNSGDNVEDLVIQCLVQNGRMRVYGPVVVGTPGITSTGKTSGPMTEVAVTSYASATPVTATNANGVRVFAGPRDDPFFFDFTRYNMVLANPVIGFANPGNDTFKGSNVMSIVVEVPKSLLGTSATIGVWGETKSK